jgi:hypothetical protein
MNHEICGAPSGATAGDEPSEAARLAHQERDRWPEFERALQCRRPRRCHFDIHHYGLAPQRWEWLVHRCRNWGEVERVLNKHRVEWRHERGELLLAGATIYRCR